MQQLSVSATQLLNYLQNLFECESRKEALRELDILYAVLGALADVKKMECAHRLAGFCILYGNYAGVTLFNSYDQKFTPRVLWSLIKNETDGFSDIDIGSFPGATWEEIAQTGHLLRRNSEAIFGYNPDTNNPKGLENLYDLQLIAEEAEGLKQKLNKRRTKKLKPLHTAFTCNYCWREINSGKWCEYHTAGTSERKKADRRVEPYREQLGLVRLELHKNKQSYDTFKYLKNWATINEINSDDWPALLKELDGRENIDYSVSNLRKKQHQIFMSEHYSDPKHALAKFEDASVLLKAVLMRAEAYLRADVIVVSKKA